MTADAQPHPGIKEPNAKAMFAFHFVVTMVANGLVCGAAILLWSTLGIASTTYSALQDYAWCAMPLMGLAYIIIQVLYLLDFFWPPHIPNQIMVLYDGDRFVGRIIFGVGMVCFIGACLLRSDQFQSLPLLITIILCPIAVFGAHQVYDPWKPRDETAGLGRRKSEIINSDDVHAKMVLLQHITGEEVDTHMFYKAVVATFVTTFVWTMVLWIVFTVILGKPLGEQVAGLPTKEKDKVYIQWTAPLVVSISNLVFGLFSYLRVMVHQTYSRTNKYKNKILADFMHSALVEQITDHRLDLLKKARHSEVQMIETGTELEQKRQQYLEQDMVMAQNLSSIIKGCICVFIVLIGLGYAAITLLSSSTHIASMVTGTVAIFFVFFMIFSYVSLQRIVSAMGKWMREMPAWQTITKLAKHDVVKSSVLCVFLPWIPEILLISVVNQCIRKCRGIYQNYPPIEQEEGEEGDSPKARAPETLCLTPRINARLETMRSWDWPKLMVITYALCLMYLAYTICFPLLNVLLAGIRYWLATLNLNFGIILVCVFLIGVLCFLCPTVPGMVVYIFAGILVADQCPPKGTEQGFWTGVVINFALCWFLKLMACAIQQVCIGGMLSKSLWVRQTVGVHTTFIRCLEVVMRKKGLSAGKVAILCGGPDWPTSVLAGIMRLSLLECEIGTLPIIGFIIPFALTGSFYLKSADPTSMLSSASSLMLLLSLIVTGVLWAVSAWAVQQALEQNHEEVTRPLAQNVDLEWLDYRTEFVKKKLNVIWKDIPMGVRVVWIIGAVVQIMVCHMFQWMYTSLIGTFSVSDDIQTLKFIAGFDVKTGLFTYQSLALIFFYCVAWLCYMAYSCWMRTAKGPARREALKEADLTEATWKEEYIKLCEQKAAQATVAEEPSAAEVDTTDQIADAKAAESEDKTQIGENRGISVYV